MKKLLLSVVPLLVVASSALPPAQASPMFRRDTKATQIIRSGAIPSVGNSTRATHYFDLKVQGNPLSQLLIDVPEGLMITRGIRVTNQSGEQVATNVTMNGKRATIDFAQPVATGTTIKISLQGVRTLYPNSVNAPTWLYPVYGRSVGLTADIPFSLARVQIYGGG
ncbi:DUF2808 domain-containing protein [Chlorogloeopsis sp. ULAP02]|uniref:DUF2808 domain-containing protein n=1 Tax=Chlorogloeopsis sp. ULAP02 TaxID=3107926 RepID=UPI003136F620